MSHSLGLQVLRAKLRGFHAAGASITHRISKSEKERKNKLWERKRALGTVCRHHLIAYGLLRDIPYTRIERCAENNRPSPTTVFRIMLEHSNEYLRMSKGLTLEKVQLLLTTCSVVAKTATGSDASEQSTKLTSPTKSSFQTLVPQTQCPVPTPLFTSASHLEALTCPPEKRP